jgi:dihydroflavonol-4-reductase
MNLVTGATGHIGNVLVRLLNQRGERVRAMIMPGEDPAPLTGLDVEIIEADVLDYSSLLKAFDGIDVVYHLAGIISILPGKDHMVHAVNVSGTRNVIQAARSSAVRRLVYTSSIHALQRVPEGILIDESVPFDVEHAISSYDSSKASASLSVLNAVQDGMDAVIVCPTGVIGPYDFRLSEMGQLILDCVEQKPMLYVDGAYDFVDVRDVAQGLILAGEKGRYQAVQPEDPLFSRSLHSQFHAIVLPPEAHQTSLHFLFFGYHHRKFHYKPLQGAYGAWV